MTAAATLLGEAQAALAQAQADARSELEALSIEQEAVFAGLTTPTARSDGAAA